MNERFQYDNRIVKNFLFITVLWGVVGMLVGLIIATQMVAQNTPPDAWYYWIVRPFTWLGEQQWFTFGRLRPLHTNAVIFAFVGNGIFAGAYYSMQRLLKARMFSDVLSKLHFWGWQFIIVCAAVTLPLGITTGKEYAELEWPIDILITLVWVVFGINMFGTILKRRERHLYVAIWFYIATWVTVAMLHITNSMELPISFLKSYSWYAGVQDALVQWWYGHNAVAFFLTTPYLGLMYYFMPKAANRPVYSYKLSIIHFWALIFIYIWAGPHHLLYSALPDWAQSLGVVFSVMLIAPSWGGMLNGLLTLRGAWDRVREDPVLKFMVVAVTCYGMSTLEGPLLSVKYLNAIAHFTDWIIAHVHIGGIGWNGMLTFGIIYWMVPRLYGTKLHSTRLANVHFWIATLGIVFYAIPLYFAGFFQAMMWKEFTPDGFLVYKNFLDTVVEIKYAYWLRALGGLLYLIGAFIMVYNVWKTAKAGKLIANEDAEAPALEKVAVVNEGGHWHRWIERRPIQMLVASLVLVAIGGLFELVPTFLVESNIPTIASVKPYTPLELHGRDIYVREGCYTCHSQMIRPFRSETERYGEYAKAGEFVYDHPFQWGSKRTGPDLLRVGGKYPHSWHYYHMYDPTSMSPGSLMPPYHHLFNDALDTTTTTKKIEAMLTMGVPYDKEPYGPGFAQRANAHLDEQRAAIVAGLKKDGIEANADREIIALIAYLQRVGTDIKAKPAATAAVAQP
ncbi:MAG: cytochrome-c oxidase, cbb3-type subunit I [Flavobacteriales bacterium]|nr:MAG: cytochrome-c oxidase, cbb3-type subunit I [Flavobacteriales bacterium]